METTANKSVSKKVKRVNQPVFIVIEFLQGDEKLRGLIFFAETKNLRAVRSFCKNKDEKFKEGVHHLLVDETEDYRVLFSEQMTSDPVTIFRPDISELYLEYGHIIQHYLGCFSSVAEFLERPGIEYISISIAIDVSDPTRKTKIVGSFFKDGCEEENIDYQLN